MKQLIIGAGEVGQALAQVLHDADIRDILARGEPPQYDVLHIAFPWSEDFVADVEWYREIYRAGLVIVHSTVPVGTCDPHGWVHSPVRGRHPDLVNGLKTFVKHVGGARARDAGNLLRSYDLEVATTPLAATTEAGKLWELVTFGVQVAIERAVHDFCEEHDLDYDVAYRQMSETYNAGYASLGEQRFIKPVLDHMPGPIGGHCVVPNAVHIDHPLAQIVRDVR